MQRDSGVKRRLRGSSQLSFDGKDNNEWNLQERAQNSTQNNSFTNDNLYESLNTFQKKPDRFNSNYNSGNKSENFSFDFAPSTMGNIKGDIDHIALQKSQVFNQENDPDPFFFDTRVKRSISYGRINEQDDGNTLLQTKNNSEPKKEKTKLVYKESYSNEQKNKTLEYNDLIKSTEFDNISSNIPLKSRDSQAEKEEILRELEAELQEFDTENIKRLYGKRNSSTIQNTEYESPFSFPSEKKISTFNIDNYSKLMSGLHPPKNIEKIPDINSSYKNEQKSLNILSESKNSFIYSTPATGYEKNSNSTNTDQIFPTDSFNAVDTVKPSMLRIPPKLPQNSIGSERMARLGRLGLAKPRRLNAKQRSNLDIEDDTETHSVNEENEMENIFSRNNTANNDKISSGYLSSSFGESEPIYNLEKDFSGKEPTSENIDIYKTNERLFNNTGRLIRSDSEQPKKDTNSQKTTVNYSSDIEMADVDYNVNTPKPEKLEKNKELKEKVILDEKYIPHKTESSHLVDEKKQNNSPAPTPLIQKFHTDPDPVINVHNNDPIQDNSSRSSARRQQSKPTGFSSNQITFDPKRMLKINGRDYTKICLSGRGGSSKVYKVLGGKNELFAIKRVSLAKTEPSVVQGYMDECKLLRELHGNPFIIQLYDSEIQRDKKIFLMVMELGEIDLAGLLKNHGSKPLSMNFIRLYWEQMLNAVQAIHDAKIVHSDLKPANFLLVKGNLKLIDFGIAKAIGNDTTNIHRDQQIGTVNYMSPEALQDTSAGSGKRLMKLGRSSDVWSLGCILYQLCYGLTPFAKLSMFQRLVAIPNNDHKIDYPKYRAGMLQVTSSETDPNSPDYVPTARSSNGGDMVVDESMADDREVAPLDLISVIGSCLNRDPKKRPTIPEMLCHSFLAVEPKENIEKRAVEKALYILSKNSNFQDVLKSNYNGKGLEELVQKLLGN
ncbi:hypothetical protein BB559_005117 [Furculomyces boomerangus]|uniref:Protein kinase domain-containing protein n=1 Tax=Furculomyces boomerangus TaxID=61424 RepID=A0A2T9YAM8_9FUNG|nr:hypothetical protein BB559_005117 [Furculomyces boomerangus]